MTNLVTEINGGGGSDLPEWLRELMADDDPTMYGHLTGRHEPVMTDGDPQQPQTLRGFDPDELNGMHVTTRL